MTDAIRGAKLFKRHCAQCHTTDPEGRKGINIGPPLFNICGRCSGIYENKGSGGQATIDRTIVWTDSQLLAYMENPRKLVDSTITMLFPGLPKAKDREDILAYLHTLKYPDPPPPPPEPPLPYGQVRVYSNDYFSLVF